MDLDPPKLSQLILQHGLSIESPWQHREGRVRTLTLFSRGTSPVLNATLAPLEVPKFDQRKVSPPAPLQNLTFMACTSGPRL